MPRSFLSLRKDRVPFYAVLALALAIQVAVWFYARDFQARWTNVPPVPSYAGAMASSLGDAEFSYRMIGLMIQNLGDTGGRTTHIGEYDYDRLHGWFMLTDRLDPAANFIPFLAAYYFGSVEVPEKAGRVVDYLTHQGLRPEDQKWRWLARAAFLARFAENDKDKALELSRRLAGLHPKINLPFWARQMPVFILEDRGEKEAALAMILETLKSQSSTLPPQEINSLVAVVCTRLLSEDEAEVYPLCQSQDSVGGSP